VNACVRFVSERQDVFFLVDSPLDPNLIDCLDVPLWVVGEVDQVLDVGTLECDESCDGTIDLSLLRQPCIDVSLSLTCFGKFDLSEHCVAGMGCLSIEHWQGVSLSGHAKVHELWIFLPEDALVEACWIRNIGSS